MQFHLTLFFAVTVGLLASLSLGQSQEFSPPDISAVAGVRRDEKPEPEKNPLPTAEEIREEAEAQRGRLLLSTRRRLQGAEDPAALASHVKICDDNGMDLDAISAAMGGVAFREGASISDCEDFARQLLSGELLADR